MRNGDERVAKPLKGDVSFKKGERKEGLLFLTFSSQLVEVDVPMVLREIL